MTASPGRKINVFLTVDTEHSIGGAFNDPRLRPVSGMKRIFGRIGKKEYGIPLMMDIANRFGLQMVFFFGSTEPIFFWGNRIKAGLPIYSSPGA